MQFLYQLTPPHLNNPPGITTAAFEIKSEVESN